MARLPWWIGLVTVTAKPKAEEIAAELPDEELPDNRTNGGSK